MKSARKKRAALAAGKSELGRSVFACRKFKAGEFIADIEGEIISDPGYESEYCMDRGNGTVLEPTAPCRFLNHSCEPNCELVMWEGDVEPDESGLALFAVRRIKDGDELTIDYGWLAEVAIPCKCGASTCRGWIIATEELGQIDKVAR